MLCLFSSILVCLLVQCLLASGEVLGTRRSPPVGWAIQNRANSAAEIRFFLALKQQNLEQLEIKFWAVSDPNSLHYRRFLTADAINQLVAPKKVDASAVMNWLLSNGVTNSQIVSFTDTLEVHTSVSVAERLFQTEFYEFRHDQLDRTVIRQFGTFSLPVSIRPLVDIVLGISTFPRHNPNRYHKVEFSANASSAGVLPQTTYQLYNVPPPMMEQDTASSQNTSQGVIEFEYQSYSPYDLQQYAELVDIPIAALSEAHVIGGGASYNGGEEGTLDIEFISTVNTVADNWYWLVEDTAWLFTFTTQFMNTTVVPQVISISYSWWEGDQCELAEDECKLLRVNDVGYVARMNTEFQKIALRGVSVIVSSGDSGAHTRTDPDCTAKTLRAEFPASSPYVTAVGATQLQDSIPLTSQPPICGYAKMQCAASGTEVAVTYQDARFTSGGGFSEVAPLPEYQSAAVKSYLNSGVQLPPSTMYNASNRAVPDVAAVGNNNLIYDAYYNGIVAAGGTSASAPIFAAIVSRLNQASIAKSGQPLGFLNPLLYQIAASTPSAFQDIIVGDNICTESGCAATCKGWYAAKGWDPVTGLGTPNYKVLLDAVNNLGQSHATQQMAE